MSKNIHTPREDLICGKLDRVFRIAQETENVELAELVGEICYDAERMEQKLISRKAKVAELKSQATIEYVDKLSAEKYELELLLKNIHNTISYIQGEVASSFNESSNTDWLLEKLNNMMFYIKEQSK